MCGLSDDKLSEDMSFGRSVRAWEEQRSTSVRVYSTRARHLSLRYLVVVKKFWSTVKTPTSFQKLYILLNVKEDCLTVQQALYHSNTKNEALCSHVLASFNMLHTWSKSGELHSMKDKTLGESDVIVCCCSEITKLSQTPRKAPFSLMEMIEVICMQGPATQYVEIDWQGWVSCNLANAYNRL